MVILRSLPNFKTKELRNEEKSSTREYSFNLTTYKLPARTKFKINVCEAASRQN